MRRQRRKALCATILNMIRIAQRFSEETPMANEGPNRTREIPSEHLTPAQQAAIEAVLGGRGRVPGPYKIWLHSPILMQRLERLGTFLVNESSLTAREQELAILCIARHWHGNYVFTVHARVAREQGVSDGAIE